MLGSKTNTFGPPNVAFAVSTEVNTSRRVGLHPAIVAYDVTAANGVNTGFNPDATVDPGKSRTFLWYAGDLTVEDGNVVERPIEFGATNLVPADLMVQPQFGMVRQREQQRGEQDAEAKQRGGLGHGEEGLSNRLKGQRTRHSARLNLVPVLILECLLPSCRVGACADLAH